MRWAGAVVGMLIGIGPVLGQEAKPAAAKPAVAPPAVPAAQAPAAKPPAPASTPIVPKPVTTVPITVPSAAAAALKESYAAMPLGERVGIQSDLIWAGDYNGTATGEFSDRAIAAVKAFQKRNKNPQTGILTSAERALLAATVKAKQNQVGWRLIDDVATGARIGFPAKLAPQSGSGRSGSRWTSARGEVQIETFRVRQQDTTLQAVFDQQKKEPSDRKVEYNVIRPDFFVISGLQGLKKFYVRAHIKDGEVRGMTVLYDQSMDGVMEPVVIAMSSTYAAFPDGPLAAPPRPKVEYASGLVISKSGDIVTSRQATDECQTITITGRGPAVRVAEEKTTDLALLRLYGARDLQPVPLASEPSTAAELSVVGIADPQTQGGGAKVSSVAVKLAAGSGAGTTLAPSPGAGFAGAAALDDQGQLAGLVEIKSAALNGPSSAGAAATLVTLAALRKFLEEQNVAALSGRATLEQAKASVVRVICVRK
jgi:peptidoglycan hydrolase-like protein with peptidoglycan-binding domain